MSAVAAMTIVTSAVVESQSPPPSSAVSHRPHQVNDQQMSRPLPQPLQPDISRKTVKTVPLKLSKYLDEKAFYNYEEQFIGFSLNSCTRTCNSANSPRPIVENI